MSLLGVVDRLAVHGGSAGAAASLGSKLTSERQRAYSGTSAADGFGTHGGADDVSRVSRRAVATGIPTCTTCPCLPFGPSTQSTKI